MSREMDGLTVPAVSVVMPVRNGSAYLEQAMRSILDQSLKDLELIVIDDGSTDDSGEIAHRLAASDPRIRVFQLNGVGISRSLNFGIRHARADWVARLDADDIAAPERLERQLDVIRARPDIAALGTFGWIMGSSGRMVGMTRIGPTTEHEFLSARDKGIVYLIGTSVVMSRSAVLDIGGHNEELVVAEDVDLWTRLSEHHLVLTLPEPLVTYRIHPQSTSLARMRESLQGAQWIKVNARRRRTGLQPWTWEQFLTDQQRRPLRDRLRDERNIRSQMYYRRGGGLLANAELVGLFWLLLGGLLNPSLVLRRLKTQDVAATFFKRFEKFRLLPQHIAFPE
jgi:glycosyltransferase involved in cell wall biosynthesis